MYSALTSFLHYTFCYITKQYHAADHAVEVDREFPQSFQLQILVAVLAGHCEPLGGLYALLLVQSFRQFFILLQFLVLVPIRL